LTDMEKERSMAGSIRVEKKKIKLIMETLCTRKKGITEKKKVRTGIERKKKWNQARKQQTDTNLKTEKVMRKSGIYQTTRGNSCWALDQTGSELIEGWPLETRTIKRDPKGGGDITRAKETKKKKKVNRG